MIRVTALAVYPVKSLPGIARLAATVGPLGLEGDRRYMLVDPSGRFVTLREHPELAQLRLTEQPDHWSVTAPDGSHVALPRKPSPTDPRAVTVWRDTVAGCWPVDASIDQFFSAYLGQPRHLVYMPDDAVRPVDPNYAPGHRVSFADGYPLLITSTASLDDLNQRLDVPVPMDAFRPNVVVSGAEAWAEDQWAAGQIGPVRFLGPKRCSRCVIITQDPRTGEARTDGEPLRTLSTFRRFEGKVCFGHNLVATTVGTIECGMPWVSLQP